MAEWWGGLTVEDYDDDDDVELNVLGCRVDIIIRVKL